MATKCETLQQTAQYLVIFLVTLSTSTRLLLTLGITQQNNKCTTSSSLEHCK